MESAWYKKAQSSMIRRTGTSSDSSQAAVDKDFNAMLELCKNIAECHKACLEEATGILSQRSNKGDIKIAFDKVTGKGGGGPDSSQSKAAPSMTGAMVTFAASVIPDDDEEEVKILPVSSMHIPTNCRFFVETKTC